MDGYWQKRIEAAAARQDKAIAKALPELLSNMQEARRSLEKEINAFYTRYATNNKISLAEAQKALSLNELADFKGDLKTFKKLAKNSIGTFNLEVENLSVKARVTRLEALLAQCDGVLQNCYQQQRSLIEDTAAELAQEQYLHALYNIEQYSGFQFPFSQLSSARIAKMLAMPVNGADISTALWRQDIDTGFQIRRVLSNMFTTGRPPQDFAKELQRIIGRRDAEGNLSGKTFEAYRLLYNEAAHISEQANLQALRDDGIEQYEVSATLDTHTCGVCQQQDGKVYDTAKGVEGVNMPPFHVNCRCTIVPYIAEAKGSYTPTRAARDENGKIISTKAQTYGEWKKERSADNGAEMLESDYIGGGYIDYSSANKYNYRVIKGQHSIESDIGTKREPACNPNFSMRGEYHTNCGYCSATYEMRRRGLDVVANPSKPMLVIDWQRLFVDANGNAASPIVLVQKNWAKKIEELNDKLSAFGDGARGSVYVKWSGRRKIGHFFTWEVENGKVRYLDPQNGAIDVDDYFKMCNPNHTTAIRWDNLEPSDMIKNACKNRGGK